MAFVTAALPPADNNGINCYHLARYALPRLSVPPSLGEVSIKVADLHLVNDNRNCVFVVLIVIFAHQPIGAVKLDAFLSFRPRDLR